METFYNENMFKIGFQSSLWQDEGKQQQNTNRRFFWKNKHANSFMRFEKRFSQPWFQRFSIFLTIQF